MCYVRLQVGSLSADGGHSGHKQVGQLDINSGSN